MQDKGIRSRGRSNQFSSVSIKRHNAYTKRCCTRVVGEGSGLGICTCMRPRGDKMPILADGIPLCARFAILDTTTSLSACGAEAIGLCDSHATTSLSGMSISTASHTVMITGMLDDGQKCLAVTNSRPIINNLAGERDRLDGPTAGQLRRQPSLRISPHCPTDFRQARRDIWWIFRAGMHVGSRKKRSRREARELGAMCAVSTSSNQR